jgi:acetyl esterase/lipase
MAEIAQRSIVFKAIGEVSLQLHLYERAGRDRSVPVSAIVFFFGGGWRGGTPSQFFPHCEHLASRGMVAISAEYRVHDRHGVTPLECVLDGKSAVRWIRAHAGELGVDAEQIAAGGGSAGGHVAACTAILEGMEEEGEDLAISSCPNALVLFNPALDTTREPLRSRWPGGIAERISPLQGVRPGLPPAIVFHGMADATVPYAEAEAFCAAMAASGNRCQLMGFEGQGHGFFNYGRGDGSAYRETVRAMEGYLTSLGYLASLHRTRVSACSIP